MKKREIGMVIVLGVIFVLFFLKTGFSGEFSKKGNRITAKYQKGENNKKRPPCEKIKNYVQNVFADTKKKGINQPGLCQQEKKNKGNFDRTPPSPPIGITLTVKE